MNATGKPTPLEHPKLDRHGRRLITLHNNFLPAIDLVAAVVLACLSGLPCLFVDRSEWTIQPSISSSGREVLLCNIILVLALREPGIPAHLWSADWRRVMVTALFRCTIVVVAVMTLEFMLLRSDPPSWFRLLIWSAGFVTWFCVSRAIVTSHGHHLETRRLAHEGVTIVGAPDVAAQLAIRLADDTAITAILDEVLGEFEREVRGSTAMTELLDLTRAGAVGKVVVTFGRPVPADVRPVAIRNDRALQISVRGDPAARARKEHPRLADSGEPIKFGAGSSLLYWNVFLKSIIDLVGAVVVLCLLSPVILIISLAIIMDSTGPVIFCQQRSGWGGRQFTIFKFRTMHHATSEVCHQTLRNDPRCTRVGSVLRRTSLDELPQLWNVLRGEMSLVGPRPHADMLHVVDRAGCRIIAEYAQRHSMKPGLTGWAQIHGARGAISTEEQMRSRIEYDLHYIDHWSLWLDIYILLLTPFAVLKGENAF